MQENKIIGLLPGSIRTVVNREAPDAGKLQEIRLRTGKPLILMYRGEELVPATADGRRHIVSKEEINELIEHVSSYSLYAFEQEMKQGFITIKGGHRVGMAGQAITEKGRMKNLRYITSVNIRMSHEILGCGDKVFPYVTQCMRPLHTLLVSPPGCGKTTLLRDMIRQISDGNPYTKAMTVGVVDERSEIAGCHHGIPQNNLGIRTDVMDACPKAEGMLLLIRSMRPQVLAVDEIGAAEDVQAVSYAMHCGCKMLATAHGESMEELKRRPAFSHMIEEKRFDRYVILRDKGEIEAVFDSDGRVV
ncbi:MAG: stage III sporulation protein AA [Lachnospiraceae bacterium]|nr:stage III sporulation protein AA [Dorea sp.]MCI9176964.1 stage III sporulation protein AA [Lachnospiraceae bacterium]